MTAQLQEAESAASASSTRAAASGADRTTLFEIQALRALAVTLVVAYHVWPQRLTGGFIGVDVFFVISGFLITAHLMREYELRGRLSLSQFWARRIRRLLPAAFVVLASCAVMVLVAFPAVLREEAIKQIAAASAYVLNWVLAFDAVDYLASGNSATLVQHFWTLSVEEQFYVGWPVLLVAVAWLLARLRKGPTQPVSVHFFAWLALAVVAVSFAYSVFLTWFSPAFSYFSTATRAWEFAAGALLAAMVMIKPQWLATVRGSVVGIRSGVLTAVGVVTICGAAWALSGALPFPGYLAALPVAGTILVIVGGMPSSRAMSALIRMRPVQFVGDVSYSLYLWHWPALVTFVTLGGRPPTTPEGFVIVALSLALAAATKYLVEDPARRPSFFTRRRIPAYLLAVGGAMVFVLLSVTVGAVTTAQADAERAAANRQISDPEGCFGANAMLGTAPCDDRFVLDPSVNLAAAAADLDSARWCLTWRDEEWKSCELGDVSQPSRTIALVGDSHAAALALAFDDYFATRDVRVITYTRFGCTGLNLGDAGIDDLTENGQVEYACRLWTDRVRAEIESRSDIDSVVYTNFTSSYLVSGNRQPKFALTPDEVESTWNGVLDSGKSVTFITDPPRTNGESPPTCLAGKVGESAPCSTDRSPVPVDDPMVIAAERMDGRVTRLDLTDAFCDLTRCYSVIGNVVVYADSNHLSGTYSRTLMPYLGPRIP
jgi:peptidoglycan/LPS O-acetylase OafA/YrhL